jgi:hypothetical protein
MIHAPGAGHPHARNLGGACRKRDGTMHEGVPTYNKRTWQDAKRKDEQAEL